MDTFGYLLSASPNWLSYLQVFFQSAPGCGFLLEEGASLVDLLLQLPLLCTFQPNFLFQLLQSLDISSMEHQLPFVLGLGLCSQLGLKGRSKLHKDTFKACMQCNINICNVLFYY